MQLKQDDIYPHHICKKCCQKLIDAYLFREECYESHRKLEALFGNSAEKYGFTVTANNDSFEDKPAKVECHVIQTRNDSIKEEVGGENDDFEDFSSNVGEHCDDFKPAEMIPLLRCGECDQDFTCPYALKKHEAIHSKTGKLFCDICNQKFTRLS